MKKLSQRLFGGKEISCTDHEKEIRRKIIEEMEGEEKRRRDIEEQCQKRHEERVQNMYPTKIELFHCIENGVSKRKYGNPHTLVNTNNSVKRIVIFAG